VIQRRCIGNSTLLPIALGHDPVHVHGLSDEGGDGGATDTEFARSVSMTVQGERVSAPGQNYGTLRLAYVSRRGIRNP
jgi:hypothetical protein